MPNWKKVIVSGSDAQLGNVSTRSVTGSTGVQIGASTDVAHWILAPNTNTPSSLSIFGYGGATGFSYINTESLEAFEFQANYGNTYISGIAASLSIAATRTSEFMLTSGMNDGEYHGWKIHQSGSTTFGEPTQNDNHRYTFRDYSLNDILTIDTTTGSIGFRHNQYRNAPFLKVDSKGYIRSGSWNSVTASYVTWSNVKSKPSNLLSSSAQISADISGAFSIYPANNGVMISGSVYVWGDDISGSIEPAKLYSNRYINQNGNDVIFVGNHESSASIVRINSDGTLIFNKRNEINGSSKVYQKVFPLQQSQGNVPWISSIFTAANYGSRWNDVHSQGWNLRGSSVDEAGKHGWGHVTEGYFQEDATYRRFEDHTIFYDTGSNPRRIESVVITDGHYDAWYKYFTVNDVFGLDPRNNYKYFQFACTSNVSSSELFLWDPSSGNTKAGQFQWNTLTNRLSISPFGTVNSTFDINAFPFSRFALIQRTEVASTYGLQMATIAGNSADGYFGNIHTGSNLTLGSDSTLRLINVISSSAQIAADISGAFASGAPVSWAAITSKPSDLVSGSGQLISTFAPRTNPTFTGSVKLPDATVSGVVSLGQNACVQIYNALSADGNYSGLIESGTAGQALSYGDLSYRSGSSGKWVRASAVTESRGGYVRLGMCIDSTTGNNQGTSMLLYGSIRADAKFPTLTVGRQVYAGIVTGSVHHTKPSGSNQVIRVVGFANTADELFFNPSSDYITSV